MLNFDEDIKKDGKPLSMIPISLFDYVGTISYFIKHVTDILHLQDNGAGLHSRSESKARVIVCHSRNQYVG